MTRIVLAVVLLLCTAATNAWGPVQRPSEASMLVTGTIQVDRAGKVSGFALDQMDQLPEAVVSVISKAAPNWVFEARPANGTATAVFADMSVRLVATRVSEDGYAVRIHKAYFSPHHPANEKRRKQPMEPPRFPANALRAGVASTVYLAAKFGRDGRVIDAMVEQVNLRTGGDEDILAKWRDVFADVSLRQARNWRLEPPSDLKDDFFVVRVPVEFVLGRPRYGQWETYVPGPRHTNPWLPESDGAPDALVPGRAHVAGTGLKLLSELSGS